MATLDANRERALDLAVTQIEKQFGKGAIMKLGDHAAAPDVRVVSTGSLGLDVALGVGGLPRGRVVEIYGPESSGKTTLALQAVACAQQLGGVCAFVDAEHALDGALRAHASDDFGTCELTELIAYRSDLRRDGAVYTKLWTIPFGG